jgi:hypothetical protein
MSLKIIEKYIEWSKLRLLTLVAVAVVVLVPYMIPCGLKKIQLSCHIKCIDRDRY